MSALLLALLSPPSVQAYVLVTTDEGKAVQWPPGCIELYLSTALAEEIPYEAARRALDNASAAWNAVECSSVALAVRGATCFSDVGLAAWPGAQNILAWHDEPGSWPHSQRVVALTSLTYDIETGEIVDADIEMNGEDYTFSVDGAGDRYDLEQALTHELGHVLGLDHSPIEAATMFALSHPGEVDKRSLDPDDVAGVCANHPAVADATGCDAKVPVATLQMPFCPAPPDEEGCSGASGSGAPAWLVMLGLLGLGRRKWRRATGTAALTLVMTSISQPAAAFTPYTTDSGVPIRWRAKVIRYSVASNLPPELTEAGVSRASQAAFEAWTTLECSPLDARFDGFSDSLVMSANDRVNSVLWIHDELAWSARYSETELARTMLAFRQVSGEIVDADIEMNVGGFVFSQDPECSTGDYDLQTALTHELGHLLGLDHTDVDGAAMENTADLGDCTKRHLHQDDIDGFCATYDAPVDPPADADATTAEDAPDTLTSADGAGDDTLMVEGDPYVETGCGGARSLGATVSWVFALLLSCALSASRARRRRRSPSRAR